MGRFSSLSILKMTMKNDGSFWILGFILALAIGFGLSSNDEITKARILAKTNTAIGTMNIIATASQLYYQDHLTNPPQTFSHQTDAYFSRIPEDPQDTSVKNPYTITPYEHRDGGKFIIHDSVPHDPQTLAELPRWLGPGKQKGPLCGPTGCKTLVYDIAHGIMAQ